MRNREAYVFVHSNGEFVSAGLLTFLSDRHDSKSFFLTVRAMLRHIVSLWIRIMGIYYAEISSIL